VKILVVGASGRTGRLFTELALERGHDITAFVRDPDRVEPVPHRLRVVEGDVLSPDTLTPALVGQVYIDGTRNLADAAEAFGVRRLVVVSAEGAGVKASLLPLGYRLVTRIPVVSRLYPDIAQMERELVARTALEWTVVRAAVLTNGRRTGEYRAVLGDVVPRGLRISRADLAEFLLAVTEGGKYIRQTVALAY